MIPNNDRDVNVKRDGRGFVLTLSARWQATGAAKAQKQMQTIQTNSRHAAHVSLGGNPSRRARSPPAGGSPPRAGSVLSKCTSNTTKTPLLLPAEVGGRGQVKGWGGGGVSPGARRSTSRRPARAFWTTAWRRSSSSTRRRRCCRSVCSGAAYSQEEKKKSVTARKGNTEVQRAALRETPPLSPSWQSHWSLSRRPCSSAPRGPRPTSSSSSGTAWSGGGKKGSEGAGGYNRQRNTASAWRRYGGPPKTKT